MTGDLNPARSEPWTGYHAGMPAPPPAQPGGGGPHRARGWIALLVGMLVSLALVGTLLAFNGGPPTAAPAIPSTGPIVPASPSTGRPSGATVGTIVDINTSQQVLGADGLRPLGAGTGMVLTADGEILTNNHVVEGASSIQVTIPGHGSSTATVVGVDPTDDVALLQLTSAAGLPTVTVGDSSTVQVGDPITAIGNAFGRGGPPTATTGTVAAVHRSITARDPSDPSGTLSERLNDVIQIAADVHPGDSGGAVLNAQGQVIGIITAGPSQSSGNGTGFAIPINAAIGIVNEIRAGHGSATILLGERGFMGVAVQPVDPATAAQLGLSDTAGILVAGVQPGSPAAKVGVTAPAVIRTIDGRAVNTLDELGAAIHSKVPGQQIQVTWIDQQGQHTATVTLASGPAV